MSATTPEQLARLREINARINAIPYERVVQDDYQDVWVDAPEPGHAWECRDYTIAKSKALREAGWPVNDMFVVLCWTEPEPPPGGGAPVRQYHAVLGCRACSEVFILDNRYPDIYRWDAPPYNYLWVYQQVAGTTEFSDASATGLA